MYTDVVTLNTCVNAQTDYILGDGISNDFEVNKTGEMFSDLFRKCAFDLSLYGGFSVQIIRDLVGRMSELMKNILNFDILIVEINGTQKQLNILLMILI